jgi:hypothetical protein
MSRLFDDFDPRLLPKRAQDQSEQPDGPPTRDLKRPLAELSRRDPSAKIDLDAPERILDPDPPSPAKLS